VLYLNHRGRAASLYNLYYLRVRELLAFLTLVMFIAIWLVDFQALVKILVRRLA